jgi:mono/diheme cytochrome c family protein
LKTRFLLAAGGVLLSILLGAGCESTTPSAPPVTAAVINAGAKAHVTQQQLTEGRSLFVTRCIECHVLPVISEHPAAEWPGLVDKMAKRAELKPNEHDAVTAYILAVHAQRR